MHVCVFSVSALSCTVSGLVTDRPGIKELLPTLCRFHIFRVILNGNVPDGMIRLRNKGKNIETIPER
jgi:hypothetical protein